MRSGSNIHLQQRKTNMINEEWNKTQNDAPFVAFYDMHVVTFVLPNEIADVSIAGLQWFILIPRLVSNFSHLLRHAIEKGRGRILYSKKPRDPTGTFHTKHYNTLELV